MTVKINAAFRLCATKKIESGILDSDQVNYLHNKIFIANKALGNAIVALYNKVRFNPELAVQSEKDILNNAIAKLELELANLKHYVK